jgi:hypothetical protein
VLKPDLIGCLRSRELPEMVLVCPNPDQSLEVITSMVELLERISETSQLRGSPLPLPAFILASNGIYFQRIRQIWIEKIEESILLGRLPDLWPDLMPGVVGRLMRGVTIQTGAREGIGAEAVYLPGPSGITRLAGGDANLREHGCRILSGKGGWFELAAHSSATRLEFDKAMVNLTTNFLGQLYAIDSRGAFRPLTVGEIMVPAHESDIRELALHVFAVGKAVKAYGPNEDFEPMFRELKATCRMHEAHVPSSLQWVGLRLRAGQLQSQLTPTEEWLIEPLIRYARSAGLEAAAHFFGELKGRLTTKLQLAVHASRSRTG